MPKRLGCPALLRRGNGLRKRLRPQYPAHHSTNGLPVIFIYDGYPGGVGIARAGYDRLDELLEATLKTIEDCGCDDGCPSCVQSPKCGNNNEPLDKAGAVFLLRELLGAA